MLMHGNGRGRRCPYAQTRVLDGHYQSCTCPNKTPLGRTDWRYFRVVELPLRQARQVAAR